MADSTQLIPEDKNLQSQIEDQNLTIINLAIKDNSVTKNDYGGILKIIQITKIERQYYSIGKKITGTKYSDITNFIKQFKINISASLIDDYITKNTLVQFIYNHLIIKTTDKNDYKLVTTEIEFILSENSSPVSNTIIEPSSKTDVKFTQEVSQVNHDDKATKSNKILSNFNNEKIAKITSSLHTIEDHLNNILPKVGTIAATVFTTIKGQENHLEICNSDFEEITTKIAGIGSQLQTEFLKIQDISNAILPKVAQDEQPKGIISRLKNKSSLILQGFILIILPFILIFFNSISKPSIPATEVNQSELISTLSTKIDNALNQANSSKNTGTTESLKSTVTVHKQLDTDEIDKIKKEVKTVVNDLFKDKKLFNDSANFDTLIKVIEDLNKGAAPKEEVKGKGEEKKGKDNQPKLVAPSHKVTDADKKDIAKITSDAIKSIIEDEIKKISSNGKSKDKTGELASKVSEFNELQGKQIQLKADLDFQKKLVGEKDKQLIEFNKVKDGFKGYSGSFAILFTNSKDFPLNNNILSTCFTVIEKQPKNQNIGVYIATGNKIAVNLDLRDKKEKLLSLISPIGSPTETLGDAGQDFLDRAFEGEKIPIPVPDRKVIIVATWSAEAPKSNSSGWKDISQVDAILIQPANVQQIRYAKSWFDFVNQKNGRLLLISGGDNFDASSDNLKQLSKQISTLLNTKKD